MDPDLDFGPMLPCLPPCGTAKPPALQPEMCNFL